MFLLDVHTHRPEDKNSGIHIVNILNKFDSIPGTGFFSTGLHPWHLDPASAEREFAALKIIADRPNVLAIGECGLDKACSTDWELQRYWFRRQIELATEIGKPLVIHCVRAYDEVLKTLWAANITVPFIFHGFTKSIELAGRIMDAGGYLSFGKHLHTEGGRQLLKEVPEHCFFLETDDSELDIQEIYQVAAEIKGVTIEQLGTMIQRNFTEVFKIPAPNEHE